MESTQHPTWDDTVRQLFAAPYWIEQAQREDVGAGWRGCMAGYQVYLDQYASVCQYAVTIYDHLASRAMPLTTDETQFWPDDALAQLRTWINEGCRQTAGEPIKEDNRIPPPTPQPPKLRVRKNILDLTQAELDEYRMKIEEVGATSLDANAAWSRIAYLHTDWCLHYQEAFLLWHRANVLYLEELIDFPIPYWNWMAPNATKDGDPAAGLPQPFKDLTYIHPKTGQERPNPLRFAVAKDGRSKACAGSQSAGIDCRYVQRDPVLYTEGDQQREERQNKLNLLGKYQRQVAFAFQWPVFSTPEGSGQPWANILSFDPPPPDSDYPHQSDFDGLYEQPHDNIHGWVGPDMADNAYTAFDPVFWSHHSNIDRIFEQWKRAHPASIFTAIFPLRPFVGPQAAEVDLANPETFVYTTIGDMAKDSRALGYDFEPPSVPDSTGTAYNEWSDYLYILFKNVRCIQDTYQIDVFLNLRNPQPQDKDRNQLHYVGRVTRLGMGVEDDKGRCTMNGVTRVLDASYNAYYLHLTPKSEIVVSQIVTDVTTGKQLTPDEYRQLPGFEPSYVWGKGDPNARPAAPASQPGGPACH